MLSDELLIEKIKKLFESETGWGDSAAWTNRDFVTLSEKIQERTGIPLSHVTLKRIWGKVKYASLPNAHTLDTLARFVGYDNWRAFKAASGNVRELHPASPGPAIVNPAIPGPAPVNQGIPNSTGFLIAAPPSKRNARLFKMAGIVAAVLMLSSLLFFIPRKGKKLNPADYSFSSKTVVARGLPNSVIFDYDASKAPYDSVIIQQSWDKNLQAKVSRDQHQHTSIYYYPDFYQAKLIVGNEIIARHNLLIRSNGWLPIIEQSPVPVYFKKEEAISGGKMALSVDQLKEKNINLQPVPPSVLFSNVGDFGEIYSDDFVFETSVRNDFREGSSICQLTRVYLLCEGTAIWVPLCAKGCVSDIDLLFTSFYTSGKQQDLSAFGVDFNDYVKLRIESRQGRGRIFINDKLTYTVDHQIIRSRIIGVDLRFEGTGSVDYVKLSNEKLSYEDNF